MYNPISSNVLRQALRWMGAPKPIAISPAGPTITAKSETVMGQVTMCFDRLQLLHWSGVSMVENTFIKNTLMQRALQDCFCGDVQVQPLKYNAGDTLQMVTVLCSITARD